jgi:hypothetical protein
VTTGRSPAVSDRAGGPGGDEVDVRGAVAADRDRFAEGLDHEPRGLEGVEVGGQGTVGALVGHLEAAVLDGEAVAPLGGVAVDQAGGQRGVEADDAVAGGGQDAAEPALPAAHVHGQAARGRDEALELGQVEIPEVVVQGR